MTVQNVLPPNATKLEKAVSLTGRERIAAVPVPLDTLFDPWRCPVTHLPWLAWAVSVDVWDDAWPEAVKRKAIAGSIEVHRRKGTVGSLRRALAAQGYQVNILEHHTLDAAWTESDGARWDGKAIFDGSVNWSGPEGTRFAMTRHWAEYALELDVGDAVLTRATQANIRAIANATAPARSHLVGLRFCLISAIHNPLRWGNTTTRMVVTDHYHVPHFATWRYPKRVWGGTTAMTWDGAATWGDNKRFDGILGTESDESSSGAGRPDQSPRAEWSHGWGRWWRATLRHTSAVAAPRTRSDVTYWDGTRWDQATKTHQPSHWDGTRRWGEIPMACDNGHAVVSTRTILTYPDGHQEVA